MTSVMPDPKPAFSTEFVMRQRQPRVLVLLCALAVQAYPAPGAGQTNSRDTGNKPPARLEFRLPAQATLILEGIEIPLTGALRRIRTAPLVPDVDHSIKVEAFWSEGTRERRVQRQISVRGGAELVIDLQKDSDAPSPPVPADEVITNPTCGLGRFLTRLQDLEPLTAPVEVLEFGADLKHAVVVFRNGRSSLWDVQVAREVRRFSGGAPQFSPAISGDGRFLFSMEMLERGRIFDLLAGRSQVKIEVGSFCSCAAFSRDGALLATGHSGGRVYVWDVPTGRNLLGTQRPYEGSMYTEDATECVVFSADGKTVYAGIRGESKRPSVVIGWEIATGAKRIEHACDAVRSFSICDDGRTALCRSSKGMFTIELQTGRMSGGTSLDIATAIQKALDAPSDPKKVATRFCDIGNFYLRLKKLRGTIGPELKLYYSPDGRFVLTDYGELLLRVGEDSAGRGEHEAHLWNATTGKLLAPVDGFRGRPVFSADGNSLFYHASDESIRHWDIATGKQVKRYDGIGGRYGPVVLACDNRRLLVGANLDRKTILLVDTETGATLKSFDSAWGIEGLAVSPDRQCFYATFHYGTIGKYQFNPISFQRLFNQETPIKAIREFKGHLPSECIHGVLVSRDGQRILSGAYDGTVSLWDAVTGRELFDDEWKSPWVQETLQAADKQSVFASGLRLNPSVKGDAGPGRSGGGTTTIIVPR